MAISCVVLAKNEEKNIEKCLACLTAFNEVVVVDDNSYDKTSELAKKKGAIVYHRDSNNDFSSQRNFALKKTKNDWVFFVDADEIVSKELATEIIKSIEQKHADGFYIKREDFLWGKKINHGELGQMYLLRLAKKNRGEWKGKVHEVWNIDGKIDNLKNPLHHYPHQSLREFLTEINRYSSIRAQELFEAKTNVSFFDIIVYPKAKFFQNYFFRFGFLDSIRGLITALIMSFHSFLVRAKLWQLYDEEK